MIKLFTVKNSTIIISCLFACIFISAAYAHAQTYQNYDFIPGSELVFEDWFENDKTGEWAPHWELEHGQGAVNNNSGHKMLVMTENFSASPLMKNKSYLSTNFSIEFDAWVNDMWLSWPFYLNFYEDSGEYVDVHFSLDKVWFSGLNDKSLSADWGAAPNKLYHFAIAYKDGQMKVYVGEKRYLTIPKLGIKPTRFAFAAGADAENVKAFTNVRIANGAQMNMLNALMTDGKFITYGITFDVNKATLKPESMGTLNEVARMMKDKPDLKLEVGGHTDSDGPDESNLTLSRQRAEAVVKQLISMGIDPARLKAEGYGEKQPVADNNTFEGKAKNRRVEFRKI
ncbi:MAG: hypothetical protein C4560_08845 [Nitrospiraceae bacterium]|nr:MAG: hypothetical protein C4560_08845 [Nitrospiraceae bacterium]